MSLTKTTALHLLSQILKKQLRQRVKLLIYNVTDGVKRGNSALVIDSLESFIKSSDVYSLGIWKCQTTSLEFLKAIQILDSFSNQKITFDYFFNIKEDNILYCSEFCVQVLSRINFYEYSFKPKTVLINDAFTKAFLKKIA